MVTATPNATITRRQPCGGRRPRQHAFLSTDLVVAMAILVVALVPLTLAFSQEQRLALAYYHRALATEIVDGEIEVLRAGAWKAFTPGKHAYIPRAASATNLPAGGFELELLPGHVRLAWTPTGRPNRPQTSIVREVQLP